MSIFNGLIYMFIHNIEYNGKSWYHLICKVTIQRKMMFQDIILRQLFLYWTIKKR